VSYPSVPIVPTTTVDTKPDPYCTVAGLLARHDERSIRKLLADDGAAVVGSLDTHPTLLALLREASGLVEAALTVGGRYDPDDLTQLVHGTGVGSNAAEFLAGQVAHLAFFKLWERRNNDPNGRPPAQVEAALKWLEQLADGEMVLGFVAHKQAGVLQTRTELAADVERRQGVVVEAQRLFSRRNNRLHG